MATKEELAVLRTQFAGTIPTRKELEAVTDEEFRALIFERVLNYYGLDGCDQYLESELLTNAASKALHNHYGDKLPNTRKIEESFRKLTSEAKIPFIRNFPAELPRFHEWIPYDALLEYLTEATRSKEEFEIVKPVLAKFLYMYGILPEVRELVEGAFAQDQSLAWLAHTDDSETMKYGYLFETEEQVKRTFENEDFYESSRLVLMAFTSSKVIPEWLLSEAFSKADHENATKYWDALEKNPHATEVVSLLEGIADDAELTPGRPSIEQVIELKEFRARARRKASARTAKLNRSKLERLELDSLSYEIPYNLKVKALERAKAQEKSGELKDPYKVVELEDLISRVDAYREVQAVKKWFEADQPADS